MTDQPHRRPRPVTIRIMGQPDDVDTIAARLAETLTSGPPSWPYPNRRQPDTVRVYLEATPQ